MVKKVNKKSKWFIEEDDYVYKENFVIVFMFTIIQAVCFYSAAIAFVQRDLFFSGAMICFGALISWIFLSLIVGGYTDCVEKIKVKREVKLVQK
jgi:hypothetical protein